MNSKDHKAEANRFRRRAQEWQAIADDSDYDRSRIGFERLAALCIYMAGRHDAMASNELEIFRT